MLRPRPCPRHRAIWPAFTTLIVLVFAMVSSTASADGTIIRLSESDAVNVTSRADWHTQAKQGWYVKEHLHAEDFAFFVCDEESAGASFVYDLGQDLQPGKYTILVRHIRMRRGGTNLVNLDIGNGVGPEFTAHASGSFQFTTEDKPRDYRWAPVPVIVTKPVRHLRVTAAKVERHGIGDLPEYPLNTMLLDTVVITDRTDFELPIHGRFQALKLPGLHSEVSRDETPVPFRNHVWAAPDPQELERVELAARTQSDSSAADDAQANATNLLRGGSFDAGGQPNWFVIKNSQSGYDLTRDFFDSNNPGQGAASLRLRGLSNLYQKTKPSVKLASGPNPLAPGTYTLSYMVRSDAKELKWIAKVGKYQRDAARFNPGKPFAQDNPVPGAEWTTRSITFTTTKHEYVQVVFEASNFDGEVDEKLMSSTSVWLDAVQIRAKPEQAFVPHVPVELGLFSDCYRLYHPGNLEFLLRAIAHDGRAKAQVNWEILDIEWQQIANGSVEMALKNGVGEQTLRIPFKRRGAYLIRLLVDGVAAAEQVLDFAVIDDPNTFSAPPNLGLYTAYSPRNMDLFKRCGAGYYFTLCDRMFRPYACLKLPKDLAKSKPSTDAEKLALLDKAELITFDDIIKAIQATGMEVIPEFLAGEMPAWAKESPAAFAKHIGNVVAHYKKLGIKTWMTGDEVRNPYLPYHDAGSAAIKAEDPEAKIMISTAPGVLERFSKAMGGDARVNAHGGSNWTNSKWIYREIAEVSEHTKLPFWCIGVGWGSRPAYVYDPHVIRKNIRGGRFGAVSNVLYCHAMTAPEILVTYTNRYTNGRAFGTNDMYTGTFVPHGHYFNAAAAFVRGAKAGGEIELQNGGDLDAFYFERNGKTTAVISQAHSNWGRARGESTFKLSIDAPPNQLGFYNVDLAEIPAPNANGTGGFDWQLPLYGMLILEDRGVGKEKLIEAVASLTSQKEHDTRFLILARADGGLDLGLWMTNGLDRDLSGTVAISRRVALAADAKRKRHLDLARGESALLRFRLPPKMGIDRPIGNLIVNYSYSDNSSFALGAEDHMWAACSRRQTDASDEWKSDQLAGYIYATSRIGGGFGVEQVRRGGRWFVSDQSRSMSTRIFTKWQANAIEFGFEVDQTTMTAAKELTLMLDPGLATSLRGQSSGIKPLHIPIQLASPQAAGSQVTVRRQKLENGATMLNVLVPATMLGTDELRAGGSFGFNVLLSGRVPETGHKLELVYNGHPNYRPDDVAAWSQLILLDQ